MTTIKLNNTAVRPAYGINTGSAFLCFSKLLIMHKLDFLALSLAAGRTGFNSY